MPKVVRAEPGAAGILGREVKLPLEVHVQVGDIQPGTDLQLAELRRCRRLQVDRAQRRLVPQEPALEGVLVPFRGQSVGDKNTEAQRKALGDGSNEVEVRDSVCVAEELGLDLRIVVGPGCRWPDERAANRAGGGQAGDARRIEVHAGRITAWLCDGGATASHGAGALLVDAVPLRMGNRGHRQQQCRRQGEAHFGTLHTRTPNNGNHVLGQGAGQAIDRSGKGYCAAGPVSKTSAGLRWGRHSRTAARWRRGCRRY